MTAPRLRGLTMRKLVRWPLASLMWTPLSGWLQLYARALTEIVLTINQAPPARPQRVEHDALPERLLY